MNLDDLDRNATAHLAVAVRHHLDGLPRLGLRAPAGLVTLLEEALERLGVSGTGRARTVTAGPHMETEPVSTDAPPLLLRLTQVADVLGVSERHVSRLVANGRIPTVSLGARRLVHVEDLERFASGLRTASTDDRTEET